MQIGEGEEVFDEGVDVMVEGVVAISWVMKLWMISIVKFGTPTPLCFVFSRNSVFGL